MRFLGGFYVFPGGTVHRDDYSPSTLTRCRALTGDDARKILGGSHDPDEALGHWVAVVRELFEEVGVLLCVTESGEDIDLTMDATKQRIEFKRQEMIVSIRKDDIRKSLLDGQSVPGAHLEREKRLVIK